MNGSSHRSTQHAKRHWPRLGVLLAAPALFLFDSTLGMALASVPQPPADPTQLDGQPPVNAVSQSVETNAPLNSPIKPSFPGSFPLDILRIDFGHANALLAERWTPVTFYLVGKDRPFSGTVAARYIQDGTQPARIETPFATTPGMTTRVEMCLCVPLAANSLEFTFSDGSVSRSITYSTIPNRRELPMPSIDMAFRPILSIGSTSVPTSISVDPNRPATQPQQPPYWQQRVPNGNPPPPSQIGTVYPMPAPLPPVPGGFPWSRYQLSRIDAGQMYSSWLAYDCADAVVLNGDLGAMDDSAVDSRTIGALLDWVRAGGRLVVVLEGAGDRWRRFVPAVEGDALVLATDRTQQSTPETLQREITGIAPTVSFRELSITSGGLRGGWHIRDSTDGSPPADPAHPRGLIAEGPVGLGWVTLIGVDPSRCAVPSEKKTVNEVTRDIWHRILRPVLERTKPSDDEYQYGMWGGRGGRGFYSGGSGHDGETRSAISSCLDGIANTPPLSHSVAWSIGWGVLVLSLLVGPFDAIVLKRLRARHRAWLTAMGWTSLAAIAGLVAPSVLRSGKTIMTRLVEADIVQAGPQPVPGAEGPSGATVHHPAEVWRSGVTAIFAGSSGRLSLTSAKDGAGPAASDWGWWRGVSPLGDSRQAFSAFETRQSTPTPVSPRFNVPLPLRVGQWTFRTFMDQSLSPIDEVDRAGGWAGWMPALRADLRLDGESIGQRPIVTVHGLPMNCTIANSALQWPGALSTAVSKGVVWTVMRVESGATTEGLTEGASEVVLVPFIVDPAQITSPNPAPDFSPIGLQSSGSYSGRFRPGEALSLPGARERSLAIDARVESGGVACLHLYLRGVPDELGSGNPETQRSADAVIRLVFPVAISHGGLSTDRPAPKADHPSEHP